VDVKVLKAGFLAGIVFAIVDLLLSFVSFILTFIFTPFEMKSLFDVFMSLNTLLTLLSKPIIGLLIGISFPYFEKKIPVFYRSKKISERANRAASFGFIVGLIFAVISFFREPYSSSILFHIVLWPTLFGFFVNKFCK